MYFGFFGKMIRAQKETECWGTVKLEIGNGYYKTINSKKLWSWLEAFGF